jgi:UDP-N-acetylmuramate dehydrogenase
MATALSELTTLRVGGPADRIVEARTDEQLVDAVRRADEAGEPLLVLGAGSNVVVADEGFAGTVVRVLTRGARRDGARVEVAAGEPWDALVADCVAHGLAGVECLSGIPGTAGATPIQNVGAYGQEVADTIVEARAYDRRTGTLRALAPAACAFAYRSSAFKRDPARWLVLGVTFALERAERSGPLRYGELAHALGLPTGATAPLPDVRRAVLGLRRARAWCSTTPTPTPAAPARSSPTRSSSARRGSGCGRAPATACPAGPSPTAGSRRRRRG